MNFTDVFLNPSDAQRVEANVSWHFTGTHSARFRNNFRNILVPSYVPITVLPTLPDCWTRHATCPPTVDKYVLLRLVYVAQQSFRLPRVGRVRSSIDLHDKIKLRSQTKGNQ